VRNPGSLEHEDQDSNQRKELPDNIDTLRAQRQKLQHGLERLIDSLAEGVIDKDQFTSRMNRTKARIADIDKKIGSQAADEERRAHTCARLRAVLPNFRLTCSRS
jgi:predicted  nucleic acid-binding Zn-ribbon protein